MGSNYVRGDQLPAALQAEVLAMYVHRQTVENNQRTAGGCRACADASRDGRTVVTGTKDAPKVWTIPEWHAYHAKPVTDREWLAAHSFKVTRAGRLHRGQRYAEPACMAEGDQHGGS